jgi:pimeloyl-ACP methyl ester carboxylesterase
MLFIGAAEDHVVPAKVVKKMAAKYATPVEYKEFPNRPHFPGGPGWEEVVDYALTWADENVQQGSTASVAEPEASRRA